MSDLYTCARCKRTENHAGSTSDTPDGEFHVFREPMKVGEWLDVVARGEGVYLFATTIMLCARCRGSIEP